MLIKTNVSSSLKMVAIMTACWPLAAKSLWGQLQLQRPKPPTKVYNILPAARWGGTACQPWPLAPCLLGRRGAMEVASHSDAGMVC